MSKVEINEVYGPHKNPMSLQIPYTVWNPMPFSFYTIQIPRCAAVLDIEALVMENFVLVEQIGLLIVDYTGRELYAKKFIIQQPYGVDQIQIKYSLEKDTVEKAIKGYTLVTGDNYIHPKSRQTYSWKNAKEEMREYIRQYKPTIWAKGAALERRVFGKEYLIYDLEEYGCPKYPYGKFHDPLDECRFFANYIPAF